MDVQIFLKTSKTFKGPFETKATLEAKLKTPKGTDTSSYYVSKKVVEGVFDQDRSALFNNTELKGNFCFISKGK